MTVTETDITFDARIDEAVHLLFRWLQNNWCVICDCETARDGLPLCEPCEQRSATTPYAARLYDAGLTESPFVYVDPVEHWRWC